jgi:hypothetical protein
MSDVDEVGPEFQFSQKNDVRLYKTQGSMHGPAEIEREPDDVELRIALLRHLTPSGCGDRQINLVVGIALVRVAQ